ncbi:MAG TPA: hypothetical protein VES62_07695 [Thermoleophilaceae bacterium]|nr:hypothetical protein [Thermoleophilaceae bacterium]
MAVLAGHRFVSIAAAAAAVLFAIGPVNGGEASGGLTVSGPIDETLQDELRFRHDFGLMTDVAAVRELMADPTADTTYGAALTVGETREMDRRVAMESQMTPLEEAAEKLPGFAGHWIDQPAGGILMVAFTGDASIHEAVLRPLVPPGATMRLVSARYTSAELDALAEEIFADRHALEQSGVKVSLLYAHLQTNQVVVGVRDLTSASTALLEQRYGQAVSTIYSDPVPTACTNNNTNCWGPPLRAGVSGFPVGWGGWCSIAFLVRHNSSGNRGWLTAGHCATLTGIGSVWHHAANSAWPMGTIMQTCYPQCYYSDSGRADICCFSLISRIVYDQNYPAGREVSYAQYLDADDIGDIVCLNARRSLSWRCGNIQAIGYWQYPDGTWFLQQRFANYANKTGDSGGAVHSAKLPPSNRVIAYGVESGCTAISGDTCVGWGIYSHIYHASLDMGVTVCSVVNPCPQ